MSKVAARPRRAKSARRGAEIVRVPFHGEEIEAVRQDERVLVPIHSISDRIELNPRAQLARLRRVPWATVSMLVTVAADGKLRETACIDIDALPMWLATIDVGRVRPELREKLIVYQREAAATLRDHFFGRPKEPAPLPMPPTRRALPPAPDSGALRRIDVAELALDLIEQELAVLATLTPDAGRAKLGDVLGEGLTWAMHGFNGARYAYDDPRVRVRFDAGIARVHRLLVALRHVT